MGKCSDRSDYRLSRHANGPRYGTKVAAVSADDCEASFAAPPPTHRAHGSRARAWRDVSCNLWSYSQLSRLAATR